MKFNTLIKFLFITTIIPFTSYSQKDGKLSDKEKNELIGIISETDCIKQISESRYYNMPLSDSSVEKHMVSNVETIDANMNIFDAANKFLESKRRRFPIVENGKLIGQISQKDILKAALKLKGHTWK